MIFRKAKRTQAPKDGLVKCACSFPDCTRTAWISIDILLTDEAARRRSPWSIGPTRCPDHLIPEDTEGTA